LAFSSGLSFWLWFSYFIFVYAVRLSPFWIITLLLAELLFKEALFDQFVERNPLVWSGFIDFSFYVLGALAGFGIIHLFKGL